MMPELCKKRVVEDSVISQSYKTLGVIGGLGPMATARFHELMIKMTQAQVDQDHIPVYISCRPDTPDRTAHILNDAAPDPVPSLIASGQMLSRQGADFLAMPCVTAHCYMEKLSQAFFVPVINLVDETVTYLKNHEIEHVGLLATQGTVTCGVFQKACVAAGITCSVPDENGQREITHLIYDYLKKDKPIHSEQIEYFTRSVEQLMKLGAQHMLLACTELSLLGSLCFEKYHCVNTMAILASACVTTCGASLRDDYQKLITG